MKLANDNVPFVVPNNLLSKAVANNSKYSLEGLEPHSIVVLKLLLLFVEIKMILIYLKQ